MIYNVVLISAVQQSDSVIHIYTFFLKYVYIYIYLFICLFILFLAALGLHCCARAFSSCGKQGLFFVAVHGLLIVVASLVAEHGL